MTEPTNNLSRQTEGASAPSRRVWGTVCDRVRGEASCGVLGFHDGHRWQSGAPADRGSSPVVWWCPGVRPGETTAAP